MYRYKKVVSQVHEWVATGALKPGDQLLSVREMSQQLGFSPVTVYHAYGVLQDEGIISALPRSGFYVSPAARTLPEFNASTADFAPAEESELADPPAMPPPRREDRVGFGSSHISDDLTPQDELYRSMVANLRWEAARARSLPPEGAEELREAVARQIGRPRAGADSIVITSTGEAALGLCLDRLIPGKGRLLVETPMDARNVSAVIDRGIPLVEIYSHPRFGTDPGQFEHLLQNNDIAGCLLSPANHAPTGISYGPDVARRLVEAAGRKGVPIIENMAGHALVYGSPASQLSHFDSRNLVVSTGGFADTFGSRFGLGWIAWPGRQRPKPAAPGRAALPGHAGDWAIQKALADYLGRRSYDRHLRRLRENLSARMQKGLSLVFQNFPDGCTVSRPSGGYLCWVRGPTRFNAVAAAKNGFGGALSFAPGPLFSVTRAFGNFIALNFSFPWTAEREQHVAMIGEVLETARQRR